MKRKENKKVYFSAKFTDKTSPSMVAREYYKYLKPYCYTCKQKSKVLRFIHFLFNLRKIDTVFILGRSKFNYYVAKLSKKFGKRIAFLMHSYRKIEDMYDYDIHQLRQCEIEILKLTDKIICVSKYLAETVKKDLPEYKNKIYWVNNGITKYECENKVKNSKYVIMSTGGGLRIKNNLAICEAIKKINNKNIKFVVIGELGVDGEKIKKYSFVEFYEYLPHDIVLEKMKESDLYIQNSFYESFGLAICEAICMKCNILISKNIGMIDVLEKYDKNIIIKNNQDIEEIKDKIVWTINNDPMKCKLDYNNTWKKSSEELIKFLINKD